MKLKQVRRAMQKFDYVQYIMLLNIRIVSNKALGVLSAAALFILLAASAGAWVVSSYLFGALSRPRNRAVRAACRFGFEHLLALYRAVFS